MALDSLTALAGTQLTLQGRVRAKKMLDKLPARLEEGERVLYLATSSRGGLVAATDFRLIAMRGSDEVHEIAYDRMISFAAGKDRRKPFIQVQTEAGDIVVNGLSAGFDEICRLVHRRMWDVSLERIAEPAPVEPIRRAASGAA